MQNRAGRSSPADQNALFSEFSPFTRAEREAASLRPPPAPRRPELNTNLPRGAVWRLGGSMKDTSLLEESR
ncbi:hypothetical protein CesoFtcFv8_000702 [Champsocephalus esox]|uniref:Uncharacterized protein n=1 Tax=Champsocephalus esox TaxID=159716 RepID=A0AAN8D382_9TELE|nr:hypothetical protein CesoFtcFv8_000702 [Champsocephalus esox]